MSFLATEPLKHLILYFHAVKVLQVHKSKTTAGTAQSSSQNPSKFKESTTVFRQNLPQLKILLPRAPTSPFSLL